jgi:GR25 family glycosyltransferase involved in LPS biosynthesis
VDQLKADQSDMPAFWAFFDRIYCISLKTRPDRRALAEKQFAAVGLLPRVEFVVVAIHPTNREEGIFQSHMICLNKGLYAKARNILIFEDDVFFQETKVEILPEVCRYLESAGNWDALFLGCITDGSKRIEKMPLAKITYRCLAHAYALNRPFAKDIVRQSWQGVPFDEVLRRHNREFYALYPMCAFQGLAGSDNQTVVIDRLRRIFGGLPFIQKVNELYRNHTVVLFVPPALLLLLAILTLKLW